MFSERDIRAWFEWRSDPELRKQRIIDRELMFERMFGDGRFIDLHVAPYFRGWLYGEARDKVLREQGIDPKKAAFGNIPHEVMEMLASYMEADSAGFFNFEAGRLYLGHTAEDVSVPTNEAWHLRTYFVNAATRESTNLTAHLTAPDLHPGMPIEPGPVTYEILNEGREDLRIGVSTLVCIAAVSSLNFHAKVRRDGSFNQQYRGKIEIGRYSRW